MHTSVFLLIHHEWLSVRPLLFPPSTGEYRAPSLMFAVLPLWVLLQFCHKASNQTPVLFASLPKLVQLLFWEAVCQGLVAVPSKHPVSGAAAAPQIPGTCLVFAAPGSCSPISVFAVNSPLCLLENSSLFFDSCAKRIGSLWLV